MFESLFKHGIGRLILVVCTMLGAFGGFPEPPKAFKRLASNQMVQWALVFVLLFQGGANADPVLAGAATVATFFAYKALRALEGDDDLLLV
jgi:hypothetical protein